MKFSLKFKENRIFYFIILILFVRILNDYNDFSNNLFYLIDGAFIILSLITCEISFRLYLFIIKLFRKIEREKRRKK